MEKNNISEEVTITPVIKDLERLFNRLLSFGIHVVKWIVSLFIAFLFLCKKYFISLSILLIIGLVAGYYSQHFLPQQFASALVVELNVDARAQLEGDVSYLNSLMEGEVYEELATILKQNSEQLQSLRGVELKPYASYLDQLDVINSVFMRLDTAVQNSIGLASLLNVDNKEYSTKFTIIVYAEKQGVFALIEDGLLSYLERVPELQKSRKESVKNLQLKKAAYEKELLQLDTLKKVMNQSLLQAAKAEGKVGMTTNLSLGNKLEGDRGLNPLNVYNLHDEYINNLVVVNERLGRMDRVYHVHSHFSHYGSKFGWKRWEKMLAVAGGLILLEFLVLGLGAVFAKSRLTGYAE